MSSFAGAGGNVRVFEGATERTSASTFSVLSSTGVSASIDSAGVYSITGMSADTGAVTFRATFAGTNRDLVYSISKSRAGAGGAAAKSILVTSTHQTFNYAAGASIPDAQTTTLVATRQNTSATTTWKTFEADGTTEVALNASYITTSGDTATISHTQFDAFCDAQGTSGIVVAAQIVDGATFADRISIVRVRDGTNGTNGFHGLTAFLTNESHSLAATSAGVVSSFAEATGTFKVFYGSTDVTSSATFSKITQTSGVTGSIDSAGVYAVTSMTPDQGFVRFQASYNPGAGFISVQKDFNLSKSKAGADGSAAKTLTIISDRQTITFDNTGALNPSSQTTAFTASKANSTATVTWSITDAGGTAKTPVTSYLSAATGDAVTMTAAQFNAARGSTNGVIVTGTMSDGGTHADKISVLKVQDGATGPTGPTGPSGPTGPTGPTGPVGSDGRPAIPFIQDTAPSAPINGDTWYKPSTKEWFVWNGSVWTKLLGNIASYDQISASQIAVTNLAAISANLGTIISSSAGGTTTMTGAGIKVQDGSGVVRVKLGILGLL